MMQYPNNRFAQSNAALYGMFISVALVAGYIESFIPMPHFVPGIKIGLSNIIILWVLYSMGIKAAAIISLLRVFLSGFLFGNVYTMMFGFAGAILSLAVMALLKRTGIFSIIGVSIAGAVCHNAGQIIVAMIVFENIKTLYYFPVLIISGIIFGVIIGITGGILYKRIKILQTNVHM